MRKRLFEIIELSKEEDKWSKVYDTIMFTLIIFSVIPLFFKGTNVVFFWVDKITVSAFILDYILRWWTADLKWPKQKKFVCYLLYPFSFFGLIDLFSILPSITVLSQSLKVLRLLRLGKAFRVLRILRYSKSFNIIVTVMKRERKPLFAVCLLAVGYIVMSALVMFQAEPDTFDTFFDAFYWATVTLTTVGYGDLYPVSEIGRLVSMISSFMGIAIVALPTGIITAGFAKEIEVESRQRYRHFE
ncbi:MAG: ion transporter [Clostridia bacterium]|nr:ion transporter [Clostridia bacterium]